MFSFFKKQESPAQEETPKQNIFDLYKSNFQSIKKASTSVEDHDIFVHLLAFSFYYEYIENYYQTSSEISLQLDELMLFKYVPMLQELLEKYLVITTTLEHREKLINALATINEKMYSLVKSIKERQESTFNVDLKTMEDLIKSDY